MLAIYIVTLLVLMGSGILPSKVHAGSSGSSDETYCNNAFTEFISVNIPASLPTCECGSSGTISKIVCNDNTVLTKTVPTCAGCTGLEVPITSTAQCANVPDIFDPKLKEFCLQVYPRCKNIKVYRCECPTVTMPAEATTPPY
jgi:hypothetical protein